MNRLRISVDELRASINCGMTGPHTKAYRWASLGRDDKYLFGLGKARQVYLPAAYPQIATDLAKVSEDRPESLDGFVDRWGLLGWSEFQANRQELNEVAMETPRSGDFDWSDVAPLSWLLAHARGVRMVLDLLERIDAGDEQQIIPYLRPRIDYARRYAGYLEEWGEPDWEETDSFMGADSFVGDQLGAGSSTGGIITLQPENVLRLPNAAKLIRSQRPTSPTELARQLIVAIIRPNLRLVTTHLTIGRANSKMEFLFGQSAQSIGIVYWHLARIVAGVYPLVRCEACEKPFAQTDRRQRFCPPGPKGEPDPESRCAKRAQATRLRKKAKEERIG